MTTFTANISELEQSATDLQGASDELHTLFEEYANTFMSAAGIAYQEGTEVYQALHDSVEAAVKKAEENVTALAEHSKKASIVAANIQETENASVSRIRGNMGQ